MKLNSIKKTLSKAAPLIIGGIGAGFVQTAAGKVTTNDKLQAAAPLIIGLIAASAKSEAIKSIGLGLIAVGGANLVKTVFPAIGALENMDLGSVINGFSYGEAVNGPYDAALNGDSGDEYDTSY